MNKTPYSRVEIDELADQITDLLLDEETPLAILALCKAITMLGNEADLDNACRWIDEFSEEKRNVN